MKILLLHNRYKLRGGEDVCVDAHKQLLEGNGHSVRLLEANNDEISGPVAKARTALNAVYSRKWKACVAAEIATFRPDVAHVHNTFPLLSPSVINACRQAAVPVVYTLHNYRLYCPNAVLYRDGKVCEDCLQKIFPWPGILHGCYRGSKVGTAVIGAMSGVHRALGTFAQQVDAFVVLTEFAKNKFVAARLPEQKITVVPNWLERDPGIGNGEGDFFLYVGRLSAEKGITTVLQAWNKIGRTIPLKIVGAGPLDHLVLQHLKTAAIEYLGHQPITEVFRLMGMATALIVPSECFEGMPRSVIEAFGTGTPVIASRLGSLQCLVEHRRSGLLFRPADAEDLVNQVYWLRKHREHIPAMRKAARYQYETKYTAERIYDLLLQVYQQVIDPYTQRNQRIELPLLAH